MLVSAAVIGKGQLRDAAASRTICAIAATWRQSCRPGTGARYGSLTSQIKLIPTRLRHTPRNVRTKKKVRQGACFEASNRARRPLRRVEPHRAARPSRSARPLHGQRCRGGRAGAPRRTSSRARDPAPCRARHAHRAQRAGAGLPRRLDPAHAGDRTTRRPASRSFSSTAIPRSRSSSMPRENSDDVVAEWQLWSRVLGVPRAGRRQRRQVQRAVPAPRRGALQGAGATPPPPLAARPAPPALPRRAAALGVSRVAPLVHRRARDHRAQLIRRWRASPSRRAVRPRRSAWRSAGSRRPRRAPRSRAPAE